MNQNAARSAAPQDQADPRVLQVDREKREVRVLCQALLVDMPLEFFCVLGGTVDHETVLRTTVKPSAVHAALLGLGLEPGHPLRFEPERKQWIAPSGPPVRIDVEWQQEGKTIRRRAGELMRNMKTGEVMPPGHWVFSGSALGPNGEYGADMTCQLVSIVNFEYTTIDVPRFVSNANETLEWEVNRELMPPEGTEVWMVITPTQGPATREAAAQAPPTRAPVDVVVVMLDRDGQVKVNSEPVALAETGRLVKERSAELSAVRLTAPRGAPVDELGRLLGELVRAEITNVTFVPPPPTAQEAQEQNGAAEGDQVPAAEARSVTRLEVHDGGREVTVEGRRQPLGQFVQGLRQRSPLIQEAGVARPMAAYLIVPGAEAADLKPVDFAAVHAALYVLGLEVRVEAPGYGARAEPGKGMELRLAELRRQWEERVLPQADSMQRAAQLHYEVMDAYQREINRLLDEVERLRQEMDLLQQRYNELTVPRPGSENASGGARP